MKKALFLIGILIIFLGLSFANPDKSRDALGKIGSESQQENSISRFNSTYNSTHDKLGENTDIAAYGISMIGFLMVISSFFRKKKEEGKMLYQNEERQNIDPNHLEKRLGQTKTIDKKKGSKEDKGFQELPSLKEDKHQGNVNRTDSNLQTNNLPPQHPQQNSMPNGFQNQAAIKPDQTNTQNQNFGDQNHGNNPNNRQVNTRQAHPDSQIPNQTNQKSQTSVTGPVIVNQREKSFSCAKCSEVFKVKGNATEVFCPSCGTGYYLDNSPNLSRETNNQ